MRKRCSYLITFHGVLVGEGVMKAASYIRIDFVWPQRQTWQNQIHHNT